MAYKIWFIVIFHLLAQSISTFPRKKWAAFTIYMENFCGEPQYSDSSVVKESACSAGNPSSIPGSGRSAGEGIGYHSSILGLPCGSAGKQSACNVGDLGSIPGLGRSPGEGKGYPLHYSGLENSIDCMYSPWVCKELDTTEQLSHHFTSLLQYHKWDWNNLDSV